MIKHIRFKDKIVPYDTETREGFDTIYKLFVGKIRTMVSHWTSRIPNHDIDDLSQVCMIKLMEGLEKYDSDKNVYFTTFMYTLWKRDLSQLSYKYKTKKNSRIIQNDNYVSFNYSFDKTTQSFYLMLDKHKCPISREVVDKKTCGKCEHHLKYSKKKVTKGKDKGITKNFTQCKYFMQVLEQRGAKVLSLDAPLKVDNESTPFTLGNTLQNNDDGFKNIHFSMDMESIRERMSSRRGKRKTRIDRTSFIILQLMVEGLNKTEIIEKMNIDSNKFHKHVRKLGRNKDLINLVK